MEWVRSKSKELWPKINEDEIELKLLKSKCSSVYTTKLGYIEKMEEDREIVKKWW